MVSENRLVSQMLPVLFEATLGLCEAQVGAGAVHFPHDLDVLVSLCWTQTYMRFGQHIQHGISNMCVCVCFFVKVPGSGGFNGKPRPCWAVPLNKSHVI